MQQTACLMRLLLCELHLTSQLMSTTDRAGSSTSLSSLPACKLASSTPRSPHVLTASLIPHAQDLLETPL